jgi:hypothetical protein
MARSRFGPSADPLTAKNTEILVRRAAQKNSATHDTSRVTGDPKLRVGLIG